MNTHCLFLRNNVILAGLPPCFSSDLHRETTKNHVSFSWEDAALQIGSTFYEKKKKENSFRDKMTFLRREVMKRKIAELLHLKEYPVTLIRFIRNIMAMAELLLFSLK